MFVTDYFAAREVFRRVANHACDSLELSARGPRGEPLTIDILWLGDADAERVLLVSSGMHGVEGFAGSAVQCAFLSALPRIPPGCAVVLTHALNPWGYAHLRRVNENNVDLNRNFLAADEPYTGAPPKYPALDAFLNPPSTPRIDGFYLRALGLVVRHGIGSLRQTISAGQYEFARGLFFGGQRLEQGPLIYLHWLKEHCARVDRLLAIDLHSGLGRFGALTVFSHQDAAMERNARLAAAFGIPIQSAASLNRDNAFAIRGSMCSVLPQVLPHAQIHALAAEFGTFASVRVLRALRDENRWHHFGDGALDHLAKRRLRIAFCPDSNAWREDVIAQGTDLLRRSLTALPQV